MSGLARTLGVFGAVTIIALIDGTISGIAAATWGDVWGNRLDDLALFGVAVAALWQWMGRLQKGECCRG